MNGLAQAERDFDSRLPSDFVRKETRAYVAEIDFGRRAAAVTDADIENFIALLVASKNIDAFLEDEVGMTPNANRDYALYIAVARQWVKDINQVGNIIGPVFWQWAKGCTIDKAKRESFESRLN
jgi:hypothetical protein